MLPREVRVCLWLANAEKVLYVSPSCQNLDSYLHFLVLHQLTASASIHSPLVLS